MNIFIVNSKMNQIIQYESVYIVNYKMSISCLYIETSRTHFLCDAQLSVSITPFLITTNCNYLKIHINHLNRSLKN